MTRGGGQRLRAGERVYQFKVVLLEVAPPIWRTIQVPESYSFWDLHVTIQDAMGWLDYHLHVFRMKRPGTDEVAQIGIPDEDAFEGDEPILPGWHIPIASYFAQPGAVTRYEYDFGDGWEHDVTLEAVLPAETGGRYPRCLAGERACPPEDCGGGGGYENLMAVMQDPSHEEYESTLQWLGGRFDPERFSPKRVKFDDPRKRWNVAFGRAVQSPRRGARRASRKGRGTSPGASAGRTRAASGRRRPATTRTQVTARPRTRPEAGPLERSLGAVVDAPTYAAWLDMLRSLAPDGRTHRLSVVVAGMLRHAVHVAVARSGANAPEGSAAASLVRAAEESDPEQVVDQVGDMVERLFRDAKVTATRVNARGDQYSILDSAIQEFAGWYAMPWE